MIIFEQLLGFNPSTISAVKEPIMLLGLEDFDIDIFLRFEDDNIYIYYIDFETIPELANIIPLGSFDTEERFRFIDLSFEERLQVGFYFLRRDLYIDNDSITGEPEFRVDLFYYQFKNIPEVVEFCEKFINQCKGDNCQSWCDDINNQPEWYIFPDYVDKNKDQCFTKSIPWNLLTDEEKYYAIVVYFNGIYRTAPRDVQNFGIYEILTDIDFELNKYSMILDIKEFFTKEFIYFLKTQPGALPFGNDFGTHLKTSVQTKNLEVRQIKVENEINFFIINFNALYGDLVEVKNIDIVSKESPIGADSWVIEVYANVKQERLIYRLEI
jgi:hypothetical protein